MGSSIREACADKLIRSDCAEPSTGGLRPERHTWVQTQTWQRPDGSTYERRREVTRWASSFAFEPWVITEGR